LTDNNKLLEDKLDKIIKKLDIITITLLYNSGLKKKDIAEALNVSEDTIERTIHVSKLKITKSKKSQSEKIIEQEETQEKI
jgi:DNA-binding transcriptional regulator LsrR (DeoR family)